jgi:hypothetical protein
MWTRDDGIISRNGVTGGDVFDLANLIRSQLELEDVEVLAHVIKVRGSGERQHTGLDRESEDDLSGSLSRSVDDRPEPRTPELGGIRGQQRETLIDDSILATELADVAIPSQSREAAVLDERRADSHL